MKQFYYTHIFILLFSVASEGLHAQGIHFSQYFHAPLLVNPANAALMPDNDYRVGFNYRNQYASIPVPYRTFSAFTDFQLLRNRNLTNWMGVGLSLWNDKAGDGDLALTRFEGTIAYHVQMGNSSIISAGVSVATAQRTIDFNKFLFHEQWDGFSFDENLPNREQGYSSNTQFYDLSAGINFSFFPNENLYWKMGVSLAHINQPKETFYGGENRIGLRPTANLDLKIQLSPSTILNPSLYYTFQKGALEFLYGTLFEFNIIPDEDNSTSLLLGGSHRWNEALVIHAGIDYQHFRIMMSYDYTLSPLKTLTGGRGAFEIGCIYQAVYSQFSQTRPTYHCPRF